MIKIIEIPQVNPKQKQKTDRKSGRGVNEAVTESILVPKINPGEKVIGRKSSSLFKRGKKKKILMISSLFILALLIFVLISGFLFYRVYKKALAVQDSVQSLISAGKNQDLEQIKLELQNTKNSLENLHNVYSSISWMRFIPFFGDYIKDGEHGLNGIKYGIEAGEVVIEAVEPYADIIGFVKDSKEAESGQETAQDRLDFVIKTIPDLIPKADLLSEKVELARSEIDNIDPERYPETLGGYEIRVKLQKGIELIDLASKFVTDGKPLLEAAPYILGSDESRTYLILFQNDKELRPTGGFITAYSIAKVEGGKFEPVSSNDIYNLDNLYSPKIPATEPIIKHLKGPYVISKNFRLRDLNWSPDFSESMQLFVNEIKSVGIKDIDGVIAVDTQVVVYLLNVLGKIGVSGFGDFSTEIVDECNCPQVVHELESFADIEGPVVWSQDEPDKIIYAPPNYENRKKIIGPLMNSILANALGQPKDKLPALFEAAFNSLVEKHVLFYMLDGDSQKAVEKFGIAGRIEQYDGDYLHINDANLGGRKSNLYVTHEVAQEIEVAKDGSVEKTVEITYKNPEPYDGWLNSVLPNYVRIYVPKGSELIAFDGVEEGKDPYEELGKTVFAGFFKLRPQGVAKITVKYKLPFKVKKEYKLFIQKQPGTDAPLYVLKVKKYEEELFLKTDKEMRFRI